MPDDSFVLKYFQFLKDYLSVGPPVYFVVNNTAGQLNLADENDQNKLCLSLPGCDENSLAGQVNSLKSLCFPVRVGIIMRNSRWRCGPKCQTSLL